MVLVLRVAALLCPLIVQCGESLTSEPQMLTTEDVRATGRGPCGGTVKARTSVLQRHIALGATICTGTLELSLSSNAVNYGSVSGLLY